MDLNELLERHQLAMMAADGSSTDAGRKGHLLSAGTYAGHIHVLRDRLGLPAYSWPIDCGVEIPGPARPYGGELS